MQEERFEDAYEAFDQALRIQPDSVVALNNLGVVCQKLGIFEDAIGLLYQARELVQDDFQIPICLATAFQKAGHLSAAISTYRIAMKAHPEEPNLIWNLGLLFFEENRFQEALEEWESLLSYRDKDANVLLRIGDALMRLDVPKRPSFAMSKRRKKIRRTHVPTTTRPTASRI